MSSDTPTPAGPTTEASNNLTQEQRKLAVELGLNPDAMPPLRPCYFDMTHGAALEKIDTLTRELAEARAEIERRDAFMVTAAETLRKTEAENERMREALERIAVYDAPDVRSLIAIAKQALASRGSENPSFRGGEQ